MRKTLKYSLLFLLSGIVGYGIAYADLYPCDARYGVYSSEYDCENCEYPPRIWLPGDECYPMCERGTFLTESGGCLDCKDYAGVIPMMREGCASCGDLRFNEETGYCESSCEGFLDEEKKCIACTDTVSVKTTQEECDKCPNRRYENGTCILTCPQGFFIDTNGTCRDCSDMRAFGAIASECGLCSERVLENGYCYLKECPTGYTRQNGGITADGEFTGGCMKPCAEGELSMDTGACVSCDNNDDLYWVTAEECHRCANRFIITNGACCSCDFATGYPATEEECDRCANREIDDYGRCSLICSENEFKRSNVGLDESSCVSCDDLGDYPASEAECAKCAGKREWVDGQCRSLGSCPAGQLYDRHYGCVNCPNYLDTERWGVDYTTEEECLKCDNAYFNGSYCYACDYISAYGGDYVSIGMCHKCNNTFIGPVDRDAEECYACGYTDDVETTKEECDRCPNRVYNAETGVCSFNGVCGTDEYLVPAEVDGTEWCFPCSELKIEEMSEEYRDSTRTDCEKCPDITVDENGLCVPTCSGEYPIFQNNGCYACDINEGLNTSAEECAKCPNREMVGDTCAVKCDEGFRVRWYDGSHFGGCVACSDDSVGYYTILEECHKCDNMFYTGDACRGCSSSGQPDTETECLRCPNREWVNGHCQMKECDGFRDNSGLCYFCANTRKITTTAEECAKCDGERIMVGEQCVFCPLAHGVVTDGSVCEACGLAYDSVNKICVEKVCGGFYDTDGVCHECSESDSVSVAGEEECMKCPYRNYTADGQCAPLCKEGMFMASDKTCHWCDEVADIAIDTEAACLQCDNRQINSNDATLCSFKRGEGFMGTDGKIYPCDYADGVKTTELECAFCPNSRFMVNGVCYSCDDSYSHRIGDKAECDRCSNRTWYTEYSYVYDYGRFGECRLDNCTKGFYAEGQCHECSETSAFSSSAEECAKCPNREYLEDKGACVLKCDNGILTDWGMCIPCSEIADYVEESGGLWAYITAEECSKCSGTVYKGGYCQSCPSGWFAAQYKYANRREEFYSCFHCNEMSENQDYMTTREQCARCPGRIYDSATGACSAPTCKGIIGVDNRCHTCDEKEPIWVHKEENEGKCPNREYVGDDNSGYSILPETCGADEFFSYEECYSCDDMGGMPTTEKQCSKCSQRTFKNGYCSPKDCGGFRDEDGVCYDCSSGYSVKTTPEECGKCPNRQMTDGDGNVGNEYCDIVTTCPEGAEFGKDGKTCCKNGWLLNGDVDINICGCPEGGERGQGEYGHICCLDGVAYSHTDEWYTLAYPEACGCPGDGSKESDTAPGVCCDSYGYAWKDGWGYTTINVEACGCPFGSEESDTVPGVCCRDGFAYGEEGDTVNAEACGCPWGGKESDTVSGVCCNSYGYAWTDEEGYDTRNIEACGCPVGSEESDTVPGVCCTPAGYAWTNEEGYTINAKVCGCPYGGIESDTVPGVCCQDGKAWDKDSWEYDADNEACQ